MLEFAELTERPTYSDAYLTTELAASYYNMHHKNRTVLVSREHLFLVPFSVYLRKHSCLLAPINQQINLYIGSGLLKTWLTHYHDERMMRMIVNPALQSSHDGGDGGHRALHMEEVSGVFQICAYMLVFSALVLGMELAAVRCNRLRRLFDCL